jgi:hypothetical protein
MGISLTGLTPSTTYDGLIKTGDNQPIEANVKKLSDGLGNDLPMEVSATAVNFTNQLQQGGVAVPTASQVAAKQDTLVSGTNIKTINATTVLGSGNISVQETLISGSNIKTINLNSLLGSGNVNVEPVITGAATTITSADLSASRALVSNASGKIAEATTTSTELGYLNGVTSAIQTQIDTKTNKLIVTNRQSSSYTLVLSDADKLVEMNVATANNLTVPLNSAVAFSIGTQILLAQYGVGPTTISPSGGVAIRSNGAKLKLNAQYSGATLVKIAENEWYLFGDIVA